MPTYTGPPRDRTVKLHAVSYGPDGCTETACASAEQARPNPDVPVSWIDVDGVHDIPLLVGLGEVFDLHPVTLEDASNVGTAPKVEDFPGQTYVALRMASLVRGPEGPAVRFELLSIVLGPTWVLTLQENPGDVFDAVRQRIRVGRGRIRGMGPDYLLHAMMDAIVDGYFAVLGHLDDSVEALEDELLDGPGPDAIRRVHGLKTQLLRLRQAVLPVPTLVGNLLRSDEETIAGASLPFFRDLLDHARQARDIVDSAVSRLDGLLQLHLALESHRTNEVMRVLTIVATIFIPLTFIAGLYGMNFQDMPELRWRYGYPASLALMTGIGLAMVWWFRRRRWL